MAVSTARRHRRALVLSNLTAGTHMMAVIGEVAGVYQATNDSTTAAWIVDPLFGYDLSALSNVLTTSYTNIGEPPVTFDWNGVWRRRRVGTARLGTLFASHWPMRWAIRISALAWRSGHAVRQQQRSGQLQSRPDQPARPRTLGRLAGPERRQLGNLCAGCRRHQWHNPTVDPHLPQSGESAHRRALCCVAGSGGQWELGCLYRRHARRRRPAGPDRHPHSGRGQSCY